MAHPWAELAVLRNVRQVFESRVEDSDEAQE